jgi:hypothetical protein
MFVRPGNALPIDAKVLRPMMSGRFIVTFLKCCRSDRSRHGN